MTEEKTWWDKPPLEPQDSQQIDELAQLIDKATPEKVTFLLWLLDHREDDQTKIFFVSGVGSRDDLGAYSELAGYPACPSRIHLQKESGPQRHPRIHRRGSSQDYRSWLSG